MTAMDHDNAIREKTNQMSSILWSLAVAAIVGCILWMSGSGVPWWVYPILFVQPVVGLAQMLSDEPGMTIAADLADKGPIKDANETAPDFSLAGRGFARE